MKPSDTGAGLYSWESLHGRRVTLCSCSGEPCPLWLPLSSIFNLIRQEAAATNGSIPSYDYTLTIWGRWANSACPAFRRSCVPLWSRLKMLQVKSQLWAFKRILWCRVIVLFGGCLLPWVLALTWNSEAKICHFKLSSPLILNDFWKRKTCWSLSVSEHSWTEIEGASGG